MLRAHNLVNDSRYLGSMGAYLTAFITLLGAKNKKVAAQL